MSGQAEVGHDWPQWRSHKVVHATPIIGVDENASPRALYVDPTNSGTGSQFIPTQEGMEKRAGVGDYAMIYRDGFRSVCPKQEFEDGYSPFSEGQPDEQPVATEQPQPTSAPTATEAPRNFAILATHLGESSLPPILGFEVRHGNDGQALIRALTPDGTSHAITMPAQSGALLSFLQVAADWVERIGSRATTWEKQEAEKPDEPEAEKEPEPTHAPEPVSA